MITFVLWILADHVQERLAFLMLDRIKSPLKGRTHLIGRFDPLPISPKGLANLLIISGGPQFTQGIVIFSDGPAFWMKCACGPFYGIITLVVIDNKQDWKLVGR